jgi:23S rRNA pseudouridine1911/1915/1917 synthase
MDKLKTTVPEDLSGNRLDRVLTMLYPQHSRARMQEWIKSGKVTVDQKLLRQKDPVRSGQTIEINPVFETQEDHAGEDIPLDIIYQDEALIILNKPAGLVVHPGAGNSNHTLLNALLYLDPSLQLVHRAGIIQRLDKETSGIMVVARTPESHTYLVEEMRERKITREYEAIVNGVMTAGGTIDAPIGRHSKLRTRMSITEKGKMAITHFRLIKKFTSHTHIKVKLETGRTHQIRVHMAHIKYPIVGDPVYGGRNRLAKNISKDLRVMLEGFPRQALHASRLELVHPLTGKKIEHMAPLPEDMVNLINALEAHEESS